MLPLRPPNIQETVITAVTMPMTVAAMNTLRSSNGQPNR